MSDAGSAERLRNETIFHDLQAKARAASFASERSYLVNDHDYLHHESWIAPAVARLGDVHGRRLLDYGCGHGMAAVIFARRGAHVTAVDLSLGYIHEARRRAAANAVSIHVVKADGQRLPFADAAFDCIWGNAILHHLHIERAAQELKRVLTPQGVAVFCEPWGENRLLNWARRRAPYPGKERTADEKPLCRHHINELKCVFSHVEVEGFQFLSMARRLLGGKRWSRGLDQCDRILLKNVPSLKKYCRYVVVVLRARSAES